MNEFVTVTLVMPAEEFRKLQELADHVTDEVSDEDYENAVMCGNADDTYSEGYGYGVSYGEASVAAKILGYVHSC